MRRERHQSFADLIIRALTGRPPLGLIHTQSIKNEAQTAYRGCRCKPLRSQSRDHGVQQRERQRRARSSQKRPPGKMLFGDDHDWSFGLVCTCLI